MKKGILLSVIFLIAASAGAVYALAPQSLDAGLEQIVLYQVTDKMATAAPLTGVGMNGFKLAVGEEIIIFAKGIDKAGKEVAIWPTWKADKEVAVSVVEGRSKTIVVKALKPGTPLFITALYMTDEGKKVTGEVMGTVK
ncbi:MAG: hypothetical protein ACYDH0_13375 [Candidatus Aminicenantales bacterium]